MALTPEEIKAKGYTILTNPSQIKDYNIVGQIGTSGAKGSFLYGTPKAGRSLEGTLPSETVSGSETTMTQERGIPTGISSFANLRNLLTKTIRLSAAQGPSAEDYLKMYSGAGAPLTSPSAINTALQRGTISRQGMVQDVYKGALDLINEQEKRQTEYLNTVMSGLPKSFLAQMSGKDFDEIKSGNVSPELKERIAQATALEEQTGDKKAPSLTEQIAAQNAGWVRDSAGNWNPPKEITTKESTSVFGFQDGTIGGECGTFAHNIVDFAPVGDLFTQKKMAVDKSGIKKSDWILQGAKVGDVIISSSNLPYGHVAIVNKVNSDGTVTVTESNFNLDKKVNNNRVVNMNDPKIYGIIKGNLKIQPQEISKASTTSSEDAYWQALSIIPTQMKNSDAEKELIKTRVKQLWNQGIHDPYQIADTFMGYRIENPDTFSDTLRNQFGKTKLDTTQIANVAKLINAGKKAEALTIVENSLMSAAKDLDPDGYVGEAFTRTSITQANNILSEFNKLSSDKKYTNPVGVTTGTIQDWLGRFKSKEAQSIVTKVTQAVANMRKQMAGVAVSETELKFLNELVPQLSDSPANFLIKLDNLQTNPLLQLNSVRGSFNIPELNQDTLFNKSKRVELYTSEQQDGTTQPQQRPSLDSFVNPITDFIR